ncbi:MAG TPA: isochorismatase family protein [Galbitalea sp.]|jgi:nicotinamidase-related amidase
MTVTTLDPTTALIVVDLQNGVVGLSTAHPTADIVARSAELAAAFRARGLPVVLVNATGGAPGRVEYQRAGATGERPANFADIVAELDQQPSDILVSKQTWGAFHNTELDAELKSRGVTQVVVTGVATTAGVESTARAAHEHGYNVTIATDAVTDMSAEAHDNTIARIFPRIGETGTSAEIIALLPAVG